MENRLKAVLQLLSFHRMLRAGLLAWLALVMAARAAEFEQARWLAPAAGRATNAACPLFRKEFVLEHKPPTATLRIIGLGDYEPRVNGKRCSSTGINQPWSQYDKTIYYRDFDVAADLVAGTNCLGVMLFNSFWHNPKPPPGRYNKDGPQRTAAEEYLLCAELSITQADGSTLHIGTDNSWRCADGPTTLSHIYAGEDWDARQQLPGWDGAGFDAHGWQPASEAAAPSAKLEREFWPGIAEFEHQKPAAIVEPATNVFLYSFRQNMAAQLRVELEGGKPGDRVRFRCGEHKNGKERLFGNYVVGCELVTDGKALTHQWHSFYLGMQFVEVAGAVPAGRPNPEGLPVVRGMELVNVRAALEEAGTFRCSSQVYNGTHHIIDAAMRANMSWVMTDCPHREKLGWLECSYLLAPGFMYRYESREWLAKIAHDIRDAQEPSGRVLTVAPSYPAGRFPADFNWTVEWGAAAVMLPWLHYEWYGDPQILRNNFEMMRRFTDYLQAEAKEGLAPGGLGDWYDYGHGQPPGPSRFTPTTLSATATWGLCALAISRAAGALGRGDEARKYREMHERLAADFCRHFQDPGTHKLRHNGSPQCANAMALCAELVPGPDRALLVEDMIADLEKRGWQQTPGDVGHVYFIRALAQAGRSDVLHRVYSREATGSYGGILKKGLTSMPETWDAMMDGYQSLNHCMLGHVMEWYYGYVAGIRQVPGSIGWQKVLIGPNPGSLTEAEGTLRTPKGRMASRWHKEGDEFVLEAEIPEGVVATAILPSGAKKELRSGRQTLREPAVEQK
jgi:hypothetical protein